MKNITKNCTLYTFEELSEKAQEEVRRSFSNDSYDFAMLGVDEKFIEIFDEYFYGESYQKCEMTKFYTGGGMITGTLNPYDVLEVVAQRYPDEELRKEMEMILTEDHHLDTRQRWKFYPAIALICLLSIRLSKCPSRYTRH